MFIGFTHQSIADTHTVNAGGFYYNPASITISIGDTVVWINDGGTHDVNGAVNSLTGQEYTNPESFGSSATSTPGATIYTHVFTIPGTYDYDCSVGNHAAQGMTGTIVVEGTVFDVIAASESHNTLETALVTAELDDDLKGNGPFTVFAPSDDIFDELAEGALQLLLNNTELLTSILLHHVHSGELMAADILTMDGMTISTLNNDELSISISGQTVKIDMATVTTPDLVADNGVVHVIDMILTPDTTYTVMDIIENSPVHSQLKSAIYAAELDDDLKSEGPFTVFAPTDSAFNNLPEGLLENLLNNDIPTLTSILLHHVHADEAIAEDLSNGMMVPTMNNDSLIISNDGSTVMVEMATVTTADIPADNGFVHVIDMVLVPADPTSIDQYVSKDITYMYSLNLLGEKVNRFIKHQIVIDIYSDGSSVKRYNFAK